jgi:hypothetical protein
VAIAIGAGAGTVAVIKHVRHDTRDAVAQPQPSMAPRAAEASSAPPPAAIVEKPAAESASVGVEPQPAVSMPRAQRARPIVSPPPESHDVAMPTPTQADLLRQAWAALRAGDGERALALAKQDEQLHREGALVEEREALAICALANLERLDEARAAADTFFQQHPTSVHRTVIRRAIGEEVIK